MDHAPSEHSLDNRPTTPCPPPDSEEDQNDLMMSKEWMIHYHETHFNDD